MVLALAFFRLCAVFAFHLVTSTAIELTKVTPKTEPTMDMQYHDTE
jgi:hypothetical protein